MVVLSGGVHLRSAASEADAKRAICSAVGDIAYRVVCPSFNCFCHACFALWGQVTLSKQLKPRPSGRIDAEARNSLYNSVVLDLWRR